MTPTPTRRHGGRIATAIALSVAVGTLVGIAPAGAARLPVHATPVVAAPAGADRLRVGEDAWQLLRLTNAARERRGLEVLQLDREASRIARRHSTTMAAANDLFHTTDVSPYLDGIDWRRWGENVGYTPGSIEGLQDAFMDSTPHRHNVLEPEFRRVAIGTVRVDGVLWVTLFFYG
jgi:uncharacterized protein YkwD